VKILNGEPVITVEGDDGDPAFQIGISKGKSRNYFIKIHPHILFNLEATGERPMVIEGKSNISERRIR
jgi:hypothetical protein